MSYRSKGKTAAPESKAKIWEDLVCFEGPQEGYWSLQMTRMLLVVTVISLSGYPCYWALESYIRLWIWCHKMVSIFITTMQHVLHFIDSKKS